MSKQVFIDNLNQGKLEINIAWEYYKQKDGKADFNLFNQMVNMNSESVVDTLCIHFEVTKVIGKDGGVIKYC